MTESDLIDHLRGIGADFHRRGWVLATSGNFSALVPGPEYRLLITASGRHKGMLGPDDFLRLGPDGRPLHATADKPSAETALHLMLTKRFGAGAVLHTHSPRATALSARRLPAGHVRLAGLEMLKAFPGVTTHETTLDVPIFANTQDIPALAEQVGGVLPALSPSLRGFLIAGHGLTVWGKDLAEAYRHLEAFEFLFEVVGLGE